MLFRPLAVTAKLATDIAVTDCVSPGLESLLYLRALEVYHPELVTPNPDFVQSRQSMEAIAPYLPYDFHQIKSHSLPACSAPHYFYTIEQTDKVRKRWDYHDKHLNWGKKRAKFSTSDGFTKAWDLPLYIRNPRKITWYVLGDKDIIEDLLSSVTNLGKKRSIGKGRVISWTVELIQKDYSLIRQGYLSQVIPLDCLSELGLPVSKYGEIRKWGWKSPIWLPEHQTNCVFPCNNVSKQSELLNA